MKPAKFNPPDKEPDASRPTGSGPIPFLNPGRPAHFHACLLQALGKKEGSRRQGSRDFQPVSRTLQN